MPQDTTQQCEETKSVPNISLAAWLNLCLSANFPFLTRKMAVSHFRVVGVRPISLLYSLPSWSKIYGFWKGFSLVWRAKLSHSLSEVQVKDRSYHTINVCVHSNKSLVHFFSFVLKSMNKQRQITRILFDRNSTFLSFFLVLYFSFVSTPVTAMDIPPQPVQGISVVSRIKKSLRASSSLYWVVFNGSGGEQSKLRKVCGHSRPK